MAKTSSPKSKHKNIRISAETLEREYSTTLSNRDRDRLLNMLDADLEPNEGLREAAGIYKKLIVE